MTLCDDFAHAYAHIITWLSLAEEYGLDLQYRKSFTQIWSDEKDHRIFGPLSQRMGVVAPGGELTVSEEEMEAAGKSLSFLA